MEAGKALVVWYSWAMAMIPVWTRLTKSVRLSAKWTEQHVDFFGVRERWYLIFF
jgi:hypothetical protein